MKRMLLFIMLLLLAACNGQNETPVSGTSPVQIQRLNSDYAPGNPRISFALFDGPELLTGVTAVEVTAQPVEGENGEASEGVTAVPYTDYELPYWVAYPHLPTPGIWGLTANVTLEGGQTVASQFLVEVKEDETAVTLGETAPPSQNRTLATEPDLHKLSSGNDPNPALYQMTVAEAVQTGKPTVVAFATPGLCQTKWCSPVVESVETVYEETGEAANFIHIEIYEDFQDLTLVPQLAEWGLETEPWVFVLDGDGRVTASFEGPLSPRELGEAVRPLLQ
jgi:hypothetical protein